MISIVIPLYNKAPFVTRALDSIASQTFQYYEVIIINDGSTDNSKEVAEHWIRSSSIQPGKYKIISQENKGVSVARNRGVSEANNKYIAFLDSDDFWEINHLYDLAQLIERYGSQVDIFSNAAKQYQNGTMMYPKLGKFENFTGIVDFFEVTRLSSGFVHSSGVCIKKMALLMNPFPTGMSNFEDLITWARIANRKGIAFCHDRTYVQVIDNAEASLSVDFYNYVKFEKLISDIDCDLSIRRKYLSHFMLFNIFFARLKMPFYKYVLQVKRIFGKSRSVTFYSLLALLAPRSLIICFRNIRKTI